MCICLQRVVCTNIVQLSGATGDVAGSVNGFYEPLDEIVDNATVYASTAKSLVDITLQGGFSTCMVYGQTG